MPTQIITENFCQILARFSIRHLSEPRAFPSLFVTFDDEGAGCLVEFVRVCGEDSCFGFAEGERQTMKQLIRAVPDILIPAHAQLRLEVLAVSPADCRIDAIRSDEQVAA